MDNQHPRDILLGAQARTGMLPVCDHYSGIPSRMVRSLQLQTELMQEFGTCVMDVTLDCEDGAPVGREADHAALVADLVASSADTARVAVRVHPLGHPAFAGDLHILLTRAGHKLRHIMIPKKNNINMAELLDNLFTDSALPGNDIDIIKRMNKDQLVGLL